MNIDLRTLAILLGITNVLQVIATFLQYLINRTYRGIGWWVLGFASGAAGFILLLLRDGVSIELISIILPNALLVLGEIFQYIGILRFLDRKENRWIIISILAVYLLSFSYFTYLQPDFTGRSVSFSAILIVISILIAQALFVNKTRSITASANFTSAVFLAQGCFFAFRAAATLTAAPADNLFTPTLAQTTSFLESFTIGILSTFGLIIMVNQRLSEDSREAKENLELIFNASPDAVLITRLTDGCFADINAGFTATTGFTRAEVIGKSILEVNIWKNPAERQQVVAALNETGLCENLEAVFQRKDGSQFTGIVSARLFTLRGAPHLISVARDITARKQAESQREAALEDLHASRRQLADIIDFLPDATAAIDRNKRVIFWNKAMEDMTGIPAAEMIGRGDYAYTLPFYGEARPALVDLVFADQAELAARYPTLTREGDTLLAEAFCNALYQGTGAWVIAKASPLHDQFGSVIGAIESIRDITDRKQAEEALRESEEKYRFLTESMKDVVWILDPQTLRFLYVSPSVQLLRGFTPEEVIAEPMDAALTPEGAAFVRSRFQRRLAELETASDGDPQFYAFSTEELEQPCKDGATVWTEVITRYWRNKKTGRIEVHGVTRDITKRRQVEAALRDSEEKYRRLVDNANEAILVAQDGWLKFVNRRMVDLTGYAEQELTSKPFVEFIHPDDRSLVTEHHRRRLQGNVSQPKYTFRLMICGGGIRWIEIGAVLIEWAGRPATLSFLSDITERQQTEEALQASQQQLADIINFLPDATATLDRDRRIVVWNKAMEDMTGVPAAEMIGRGDCVYSIPFYGEPRPSLMDLIFADQAELAARYPALAREGSALVAEAFCNALYDHRGAWVTAKASPLHDQFGSVIGAIESIRDITDRKRAEEALRDSEEKYRRIVETANEGIISLDRQARITFVNPQMAAMLGYPVEDMLGQPFESFLAEDQLSDHAAQMKLRAQGQSAVYERCFRRKDGSPSWALVSASPILDADGKFAGSFGMLVDITKRKRAESQREAAHAALRETNAELQTRNEELDAFAHTVAHDLINPLGVMMGYAELLAETYDTLSTEVIQQTLTSINRNGRKAGSIIESLLLLVSVRKQDVPAAPLTMAHIVDEAVLRLASSIQDSGAEISVPDPASWPVALGHAPWIEEIWVNYLSNAIKYGGEHPRIELDAARLPPLSATARERGQGGGFIRFSVRDYGPGLTPEQQARLFVPFERLGQTQIKGHGLGLSVVRRIAEKLGGQVGVDSQLGQGSTFYFTLPAAIEG